MGTLLISNPTMFISSICFEYNSPQYALCKTVDPHKDILKISGFTYCREILTYMFVKDNIRVSRDNRLYVPPDGFKIAFTNFNREISSYLQSKTSSSNTIGHELREELQKQSQTTIDRIKVSGRIINIIEEKLNWPKTKIKRYKLKLSECRGLSKSMQDKLQSGILNYIPIFVIKGHKKFFTSSQTLSLYGLLIRIASSIKTHQLYKDVHDFKSLTRAFKINSEQGIMNAEYLNGYDKWLLFLKNIDHIYNNVSLIERFIGFLENPELSNHENLKEVIKNNAMIYAGIHDLTTDHFYYCSNKIKNNYEKIMRNSKINRFMR